MLKSVWKYLQFMKVLQSLNFSTQKSLYLIAEVLFVKYRSHAELAERQKMIFFLLQYFIGQYSLNTAPHYKTINTNILRKFK